MPTTPVRRAPVARKPVATKAPAPRRTAATNAIATATNAARRTTSQPPTGVMAQRYQIEYIDINDIAKYEWNPRDNAAAVQSVANSIQAFGFLVPCVVDDDNILVCGHTRTEAAKLLGLIEIPCIRARGLTPEQINAFRIIDNKVSEQAKWDNELLAGELGKLSDLGLDFTQFGFNQESLDCLQQMVSSDCLSAETLLPADASASEATHVARRSPQTARMVLGEFVFFLPVQTYRNWIDGLRQLHNFDEEEMVADVKRRLGVLE